MSLAELVAEVHSRDTFSPFNFGVTYEDDDYKHYVEQACYARLPYSSKAYNDVTAFYDYVNWKPKSAYTKMAAPDSGLHAHTLNHDMWYWFRPTKREIRCYVDHVINHSPWADAFLTKDPDFVIDNGTEYNIDYPAQYVIGAAMHIRYIKEYPYYPAVWLKAIQHDIDRDVALILMHLFEPTSCAPSDLYILSKTDNNHAAISINSSYTDPDRCFGRVSISNFLNRRHPELPSMRESLNYGGVTAYWGPETEMLELVPPIQPTVVQANFGRSYTKFLTPIEDVYQVLDSWNKEVCAYA